MLRLLKKSWWAILLAVGLQSASGFALLGIREAYQVDSLTYLLGFSDQAKNIDQGFRWSVPTNYYTFDPTFVSYFGSNGMWSVEQGIAVLNALTNVSSYSAGLEEFPLEEIRVNMTAQALGLFDIKSTTLEMMLENLGLGDPERFAWTLRSRTLLPGAQCPNFLYGVIQRNFDPITAAPSSYVNGNLYSYVIVEGCPTVDRGDAFEITVDRSSALGSAVATPKFMFGDESYWGYYHTGLTRDDMGGLRWLYRTNNLIASQAGPNTLTYSTNSTTPQLLFTSNLTMLANQALTNNAGALQALYPNLVILSTTNMFTNIWTTNYTAYFTNYALDPVGTLPHIAFGTNYDFSIQTYYYHVFGNLFSITNQPGGYTAVPIVTLGAQTGKRYITVMTTSVTNKPFSPVGTVVTNTSFKTYLTNGILGEYFISPTNSCAINILALQASLTNRYTNVLVSATNTPVITNPNLPAGNTNQFTFDQSLIEYSTNHAFVISPVVCETNSVAVRQGIEKVSYVRRDYDSLLNRFFFPVTNYYTLYAVTNNQIVPQKVQRVVTQPDFLFDADDLTTVGAPFIHVTVSRQSPNFVVATNASFGGGLTGPGTIEPTVNFTFNKVGPLYLNFGPGSEVDKQLTYLWGSYDGTTNAPTVYPIGTSIFDVENMALLTVANTTLAVGAVNSTYGEQLRVLGGTPPYVWALRDDSAGLPPGLSLQADGSITGTPTQDGVYDFVVRLTDAGARYVDRAFTLQINP